ncbi:VirK/YbjX family protein [Aggregatibacter actinomycetemcomitans]|uniref:VirK/YbjX family protein n=1 Tax=Aggregatibacter actinomycetemcomitans TaxID=714 RepID=UPI001E5C4D66|nr:DUF535 family protein [Aggregatibacter actinomycetemcomitans]
MGFMVATFHFPTFHEMFPVEKRKLKLLREGLRYGARRLFFVGQCSALVKFIHDNPLWQPIFTQHPYRVNTLLSQYCDKGFNVTERLQAIETNFAVAEKQFGKALCETLIAQQPVLLSQLTDELALNLTLNHIDPYEGFFAMGLTDANQRSIYSAGFTFLANNRVLIASIQGPKGDEAQDLVRQATKALHGVRPMFMLVNAFKVLAEVLHCRLQGIPHKRQAKYRWNDSAKLLFNYDEFWQENEGKLAENYWQIPTALERRPLEEIQSKKRSMYRKRYDMFDKMTTEIQSLFNRENHE